MQQHFAETFYEDKWLEIVNFRSDFPSFIDFLKAKRDRLTAVQGNLSGDCVNIGPLCIRLRKNSEEALSELQVRAVAESEFD